jgi:hypothetical protein
MGKQVHLVSRVGATVPALAFSFSLSLVIFMIFPRKQTRFAVIGFVAAAFALFSFASVSALAQPAPAGILAPGNAAVTGFSGANPPAQIAPGIDPATKTFIDLDGPSLRIIDLQNMGGPPNAQLVPAPKPFTATAAQIGQVFSVTLDNNVPPNIYAAATSAYGVPLVALGPGPDGQPLHVKRGGPSVDYMAGLWGPASLRGGPGAIWKIDGVTGVVSLFAYVTLDGTPTSAPALGGLAYHLESNSIFAVARDTGLIQRFTVGAQRGRYDHGVQGRQAQGLPPVPYNPATRSDIKNPKFNSEDPTSWGYAPPERRVFGIGFFRGRLYYAVAAGSQIWSVGIAPDGSFGNDATIEINVPPGSGPGEISKITFDEQGRMYLAERPDPTGAFDFEALTKEGTGRVLRYALAGPYPGAPRVWQPIPDEYAVGFPLQYRNGNGGVAIGFNYDSQGAIDRNTCGGFLWSTGEQLRKSADASLAAQLKQSGPEIVDGLQGNSTELVRPQNVPPMQTYFIDYDDRFDDDAARGHMGDITIWRVCSPILRGGWMLPGWWWWGGGGSFPPPPQSCPPDQQKPGFTCCPDGTSPDASGQCQPLCPNGAMDPQSVFACKLGFDPNNPGQCIGGSTPGPGLGGCAQASPFLNPPVCQAGFSKQNLPGFGNICWPTPQQLNCPQGQQVSPFDNQCHVLCPGGGTAYPTPQCCAPDAVVSVTGQCCPAGSTPDPVTGQCQKQQCQTPPPKFFGWIPGAGFVNIPCPPDKVSKIDCTCCKDGMVPNNIVGGCCPFGQAPDPAGVCKPALCPVPPNAWINGKCCSPDDQKPGGVCAPPPACVPSGANNYCCAPGTTLTGEDNFCCDIKKSYNDPETGNLLCCKDGELHEHGPFAGLCCTKDDYKEGGKCGPKEYSQIKKGCSNKYTLLSDGLCCLKSLVNADSKTCKVTTITPPACAAGYTLLPDKTCCLNRLLGADGKTCAPTQGGTPFIPIPIPIDPGCRAGTHWDRASGQCVSNGQGVVCERGTHLEGLRCVPDKTEIVCGRGTHLEGGRCVPDKTEVVCGRGMHNEGGKCVPDKTEVVCGRGMHNEGGKCMPDKAAVVCGRGMHNEGGKCMPDKTQQQIKPRQNCTTIRGQTVCK